VNLDRLIDTITIKAGDRRTASFVTAAINSWITVNGIRGEIETPRDVFRILPARTPRNQQSLVVRLPAVDPACPVYLF
jgi:hypothetical protein